MSAQILISADTGVPSKEASLSNTRGGDGAELRGSSL